MKHRVLVCGGRDFSDYAFMSATLDKAYAEHGFIRLIHGAARGADSLAGEWARKAGLAVESYPADWKRHGKAAGPLRNQQMLEDGRPDYVIAFPGGAGTADMVRRAMQARIPVHIVTRNRNAAMKWYRIDRHLCADWRHGTMQVVRDDKDGERSFKYAVFERGALIGRGRQPSLPKAKAAAEQCVAQIP